MNINEMSEAVLNGIPVSIIDIVDSLIEEAHAKHASDIHIDPLNDRIRMRLRIDGVLQDVQSFPKSLQSEIISRIKVLALLRTDERHAIHEGRFRYQPRSTPERLIDVRVSIAPTYHGENAVLRLLSNVNGRFALKELGFKRSDCEKITNAIQKPSGMILVTGPTGSGKTTTLYTLIQTLNMPEISIVTLEDPIEYAIEGVKQIQINPRANLTFANGLKSILRQDPDVIMVGEIRDAETASISVNTALTGHLLLSTLHTSDAATTLPRLLDMKAESFLVASTITLVIGQRLVRKICESCKQEVILAPDTLQVLEALGARERFSGRSLFKGKGCQKCSGTGYYGRICINEVLLIDEQIRQAISKKAQAKEIKDLAIQGGMEPMLENGFQKVQDGITTIQEVLRIIHE